MKHIKQFENRKFSPFSSEIAETKYNTTIPRSITKDYKYYRITNYDLLFNAKSSPNFKEFIEEIFLNNLVETLYFAKTYRIIIDEVYIRYSPFKLEFKSNKKTYLFDHSNFKIFYKDYPVIGPEEQLTIDMEKYNL